MIDDEYTDPYLIFLKYQFGFSEAFAVEVEGNPTASLSVSPGGIPSGTPIFYPQLPPLPPDLPGGQTPPVS